MSAKVTLATLRTLVRSLADMESTQFVSDTELDLHINESLRNTYDLLVATYEDYFLSTHIFNISGPQNTYELPSRYYKTAKIVMESDSNDPYVIRPFNPIEEYSFTFTKQNIPTSRVTHWYIPSFRPLTDTAKTFTDSEVNISSDTITIANHSLVSGDKIQFSNSGGALPTGITAATDYWAIVIDDNTFKIATNPTNAIDLAQSIDITAAAGGGTHTLLGEFDTFHGINGYEMHAVWDVAAKALFKEESDVQMALANKQMHEARIKSYAKNRDAGMPKTVTDTWGIAGDERYLSTGANFRYHIMGGFIRFITTTYYGI